MFHLIYDEKTFLTDDLIHHLYKLEILTITSKKGSFFRFFRNSFSFYVEVLCLLVYSLWKSRQIVFEEGGKIYVLCSTHSWIHFPLSSKIDILECKLINSSYLIHLDLYFCVFVEKTNLLPTQYTSFATFSARIDLLLE